MSSLSLTIVILKRVDVTDKPIEQSADEVIVLVGRRLKNLSR
jgi:hypothetical protein